MSVVTVAALNLFLLKKKKSIPHGLAAEYKANSNMHLSSKKPMIACVWEYLQVHKCYMFVCDVDMHVVVRFTAWLRASV